VWALLHERGPTPYKGQPDPSIGTRPAVTRQPLIDKPSSLAYLQAGRRRADPLKEMT
jgi:hypothetical protein